MSSTRIIALSAGGVTTSAVFVAAMWLLIFGEYFPEKERLVMVSVALGPVAVVSVMTGYAVWWAVTFVLTLFGSSPHGAEDRRDAADRRE